MIAALIRYLFPRRKWRRPPNQLITPYTFDDAEQHARQLMRYGVARSPDEGFLLMQKYGVKTAWEVIAQLPKRKERTWRDRLVDLIRRIDGHDRRNLYRDDKEPDRVDVRYVMRHKD